MQTQAELLIYVVDRLHGTNGHPRHGFIRATKAACVVGADPQNARLWLERIAHQEGLKVSRHGRHGYVVSLA